MSRNYNSNTIPPRPIAGNANHQHNMQNRTFPALNSDPVLLNQMSISEMRQLHQHALQQASAKQTELRLVLSSRYRDLVGSSDEVLAMKSMAEDLSNAVESLPHEMKELLSVHNSPAESFVVDSNVSESGITTNQTCKDSTTEVAVLRYYLSLLPRVLHRALDEESPHMAASALVGLFGCIHARMQSYQTSSENEDLTIMKNKYPLALALGHKSDLNLGGANNIANANPSDLLLLDTQIRMVYLHVQTIPLRITKLAKRVLLQKAKDEATSRGALSALALLNISTATAEHDDVEGGNTYNETLCNNLLDIYYESKAKLLHSLLHELTQAANSSSHHSNINYNTNNTASSSTVASCEKIMCEIVKVIQFDIILHSHGLFCSTSSATARPNLSSLPEFDSHQVKLKCSNFLVSHIPLLRSKIRNVLVSSVAVNAGMLGETRQSLYDTTTIITTTSGHKNIVVSLESWEQAIDSVVDGRIVSPASYGSSANNASATKSQLVVGNGDHNDNSLSRKTTTAAHKFSLWSALFSTTFSSLVHDLLSSSFHSVHTSTISTLLQSLSRAPRRRNTRDTFSNTLLLRPHEAHRNTLLIASQLDKSLQKLSDDAHHLLVHAEEREESERRLRQSLYVQTCEIMGRLLSEIRRMISSTNHMMDLMDADDEDNEHIQNDDDDATREIIIGRLCHLLQYRRLESLKILLDPRNAPAMVTSSNANHSSSNLPLGKKGSISSTGILEAASMNTVNMARGMITLEELESAFEIADDDNDGVISFTEAVEAMGGAFSGTPFNGAEMVRSTLMISTNDSEDSTTRENDASNNDIRTLQNVTLFELSLLSAKGLRHDATGYASAMGLVHSCLESIIQRCFHSWARIVLTSPRLTFKTSLDNQLDLGAGVSSNDEWLRLHSMKCQGGVSENNDNSGYAIPPPPTESTVSNPSVSAHVLAYLLAVSCEMNSAICPADSIPPCSVTNEAGSMDRNNSDNRVRSLVDIVRRALLKRAMQTLSFLFENKVNSIGLEKQIGDSYVPSCIKQLMADMSFVKSCFSDCNFDDDMKEMAVKCEERLTVVIDRLHPYVRKLGSSNVMMQRQIQKATLDLSKLFLSNCFGHGLSPNQSLSSSLSDTLGVDGNEPVLLVNPIESSRRFVLLPIHSEKQIADLELRSNTLANNKKDDAEEKGDDSKENTVKSGFGFFSSMLKKK